MRKFTILTLAIFFLLSCSSKSEKIERVWEDGVEVVINHLKPHKIEDEPSELILEEEFRIDTEDDEVANTGLTELSDFNVDSEDNIYCLNLRTNENFLYKFDREGHFITSFIRKGQGPGELQWLSTPMINNKDEILCYEAYTKKFLTFDREGHLIDTEVLRIPLNPMEAAGAVIPLENRYFLVYSGRIDEKAEKLPQYCRLFNSEWNEIRLLDKNSGTDNFMVAEKINNIEPFLVYAACKDRIYIGNSERGYEILVYDGQGRLRRKIRKEYKAIPVPEDFKKKRLAGYPEMFKKKVFSPRTGLLSFRFLPMMKKDYS